MTVTINSAAVTVLQDTLTVDDVIEERSVCSFTVYDAVSVNYSQGQPVAVTDDDSNVIFAGYIDRAVEIKAPGSSVKSHSITCKDMHYLSDKRIIAKAYENTAAGTIVADLITEKLGDEGVTAGTISAGPTIVEAVFNYVTVTRAIESLAEKSNFIWYIDYDKKLYFVARTAIVSPWAATGSDMLAGSVRVEHGNSAYRNTQYVRGGKDITDSLTENKKGDGATRAWVVSFPIAYEPTMTLNGTPIAAADIGIRGVEENKKYYWSKSDNTVSQDPAETLLASTDTLAITYNGEYDVIVKTMDQAQINGLSAIEGATSGIVEDVADESDTTSREAAFEIANARLARYAVAGRKLSFRTTRAGLWAGQILTVGLPEHNIAADMLIMSVAVTAEQNNLRYDVMCLEGPEQRSWVKMFEQMANPSQPFISRENISEDEVLVILKTFAKDWYYDTANDIFAVLYPAAADLYPAAADFFPVFEPTQKVLYCELLTAADAVLSRKVITTQTGTTTLISTCYFLPTEAIGTIAKARWYGGSNATVSDGTGVMVDEQVYAHVKTALEALQIEKTDIDKD